jgi:hypothetical protein
MNSERFYRNHQVIEDFEPSDTFLKIDNKIFKRPSIINLESVGKVLQIKINDDLSKLNVSSVELKGQDQNPELPPDTIPVAPLTHIAVDENYLYVWTGKKWKRMLLSDW